MIMNAAPAENAAPTMGQGKAFAREARSYAGPDL
jgi:hypothetical protein